MAISTNVQPLPFKGDLIDYLEFHGRKLEWLWRDGQAFIAVRPICEILGLSYQPQHRKLTDAENEACVTMMVTHDTINRRQEMLCIEFSDFIIWLAGIAPSRVKADAREALLNTRREIKILLSNHYRSRLLGEQVASVDINWRLKVDAIVRKPLWAKISAAVQQGMTYEQLRRSTYHSGPKIQDAIDDMLRLELIQLPPTGTPPRQQTLPLEVTHV